MSAYSSDISEMKFNRRQWLNDLERMEMSADLQKQYLKKGMSKREVIKLLGPPEKNGHFGGPYSKGSKVIGYDLGYQFLDPCTLDLEFSDKDILENYYENCN
jgi:hypothetical protein